MSDKKWSLRTVVLYGINCVIGSGIFLLPGSAYKLLGPGSLLAYLFVFILVMSVALCFAECGSMFEESGGPYLNNISTIGKLVPMAVFVVGGLFFINMENFTPFIPEGTTAASVSAAIITVFYAFTGFENVGVAAGDMENPTKNVPKALILSMSMVSIIYFIIQFHCIGTLGSALSSTETPVSDAIGTFLGSKGAMLVTLGTLVSVGGLNIASSFNTPRCAQALADGNLLPKSFQKCNKHHVPYISVLVTGILALLLTLTDSFTELAAISVISRFSQYIPTCVAVPVLRKKHPEMKAGYKVPFGCLFPVIAAAASVWLLVNTEMYKLVAGLGAMVIVAPLYFVMKSKREV